MSVSRVLILLLFVCSCSLHADSFVAASASVKGPLNSLTGSSTHPRRGPKSRASKVHTDSDTGRKQKNVIKRKSDEEGDSESRTLKRKTQNGKNSGRMHIKSRLISPHISSPPANDIKMHLPTGKEKATETRHGWARGKHLHPANTSPVLSNPLQQLQKKLSTRAFSSFATLFVSRWVNQLDFRGDRRVLWGSRVMFALYVAISYVRFTLRRSSLQGMLRRARTTAATEDDDDHDDAYDYGASASVYGSEDENWDTKHLVRTRRGRKQGNKNDASAGELEEAEESIRELSNAQRKVLMEGASYAAMSIFGLANAPLLLVPFQAIMSQLLLPPEKLHPAKRSPRDPQSTEHDVQ